MSEKNKGRLTVILVGFAFIAAAILIIFATTKVRRYPAKITEITSNIYKTRSSGRKSARRVRYNEKVTVEYIDHKGETRKATNIRIRRSSKRALPRVGDSITVTKGLLNMKEYSAATPIAFSIVFGILGIVLIISGIRLKKNKSLQG